MRLLSNTINGRGAVFGVVAVCFFCSAAAGGSVRTGIVVGWGKKVVNSDPGVLVAVAGGWEHSLALRSDGSVA